MEKNERTADIYEEILDYPKPPLIPLPEPDDLDSLQDIGLKLNCFSRWIVNGTMLVTGFRAFQKKLPHNIEILLRQCNIRGPGLFAPVISATLVLKDDPRSLSPLERAATLILGAQSLYRDISAGKLEPDRFRDQVLEMGQYPNLFSTSVIFDGNNARIFKSNNTTQILVITAGRFYLLNIGEAVSEATNQQYKQALTELVQTAHRLKTEPQDPSPGILTCGIRATQRKVFQQLQKIDVNRESLLAIRHSFLTLCLDLDTNPSSYAEAALLAHSRNYGNRWFHSSLQLIVFANAKACALCNFDTYVDGNVMMRGAAEIQKRGMQCPAGNNNQKNINSRIFTTELKWKIDQVFIQQAQKDIELIQDNQQATFEIPGIGKNFFIAQKVKPVPAFILALQMTAKRLTGKMVRITQFLSMSKYRCMDLLTAVVTTPEVVKFVDYVEQDDFQVDLANALLQQAVESQVQTCHRMRRYLPLDDMISYFILSKKGLSRFYVAIVSSLAGMILRMVGLFKPIPREVLVSHPTIYPQVPVVGRPGVRIPYVKYFGLHYQIWEDKIVITMMPGVNWTTSNAEFIDVLRQSLQRIKNIISGY